MTCFVLVILLLIFLFVRVMEARGGEVFDDALYARFTRNNTLFFSKLNGCPVITEDPGPTIVRVACEKSKGTFDWKLWREVLKDGVKLFPPDDSKR